jgi:guanylate kinase
MAKIFVLSAPSGAGKSTLIRMALRDFPSFFFSVSATTRPPRTGEQEGREYFFKSEEDFRRMAENGELAEFQKVHGHYYGTPKAPILESLERGRSVLIDMDVFGKKKFDAVFPEAVGIFIDVPSLEDLKSRMLSRGADSPASIEERLKNAQDEIAFARREGKYEHTIMNRDLKQAYAELRAAIERELKQEGPR